MSEEGAHTTHQTDSRPWHGTPTTSILLPRPRSHTKIMTGGVAECGSAKMYVCVSERGAQSRLRHLLKTHRTPQLHLCLGGSGLRAPGTQYTVHGRHGACSRAERNSMCRSTRCHHVCGGVHDVHV